VISKGSEIFASDGFVFTSDIELPFLIAFKDQTDGSHKIVATHLGYSEPKTLFDDGDRTLSCPLLFSADGKTLYHSHSQIYAIDVTTGSINNLTSFIEREQFSVIWFLKYCPTNRRLLFSQSLWNDFDKQGVRRICSISVEGNDLSILLESHKDSRIWQADYEWKNDLLIVSMIARQTGSELWVLKPGRPDRLQTYPLPEYVDGVELSPDGHTVALFAYSKGMYLLNIDSGELTRLNEFGLNPAWSPDCSKIAFMKDDHELCLLHLSDMSSQRLVWFEKGNSLMTRMGDSYAQKPAWSADGRFLWFALTRRQGSIDHARNSADDLAERTKKIMRSANLKLHLSHKVGIVDFIDRRIWITDGHWTDLTWSPVFES